MTASELTAGQKNKIMIITGEASGDMHGAKLVRSLLEISPDTEFFGMGGEELRNAGVNVLFEASRISVVGLTEVFSHLPDILTARRLLIREMKIRKPDLLIVIDFPDFNLMLAAKAKKLGIPVLYYVSPQVWAWRSGRVNKIGRLSNRIAVILPFEKDFYQQRNVTVDFVGHPLMDSVKTTQSKIEFRQSLSIDATKTVVGLVPGSRSKEIIALLPDFLAAAKRLTVTTDNDYVFLIPRANTISKQLLDENGVNNYKDQLDIRIIDTNRYDMMAACDVVVAASGTVILELAILGVPTVATYRVSPRTYFLGRMLTKLKSFTLVNLIAGRTIIPELLQDQVTPVNIAREMALILEEDDVREKILQGLAEVRKQVGTPGASKRTAKIALKLIQNDE